MILLTSFNNSKYNAVRIWFSIVFFLLILPNNLLASIGNEITITVKDCKNKILIENTLVTYGNQKKYTNQYGSVRFSRLNEPMGLLAQSMGYKEVSIIITQNDSINLCLERKVETIDDVEITGEKIDLYDYLIKLRDENTSDFLAIDTTLYYDFEYSTTNLSGDTVLDSANGKYRVHYKNGLFPLKMFNAEDAQITEFNYYKNSSITEANLKNVKYENLSGMLAIYDFMGWKSKTPWERIKNHKEVIDLQIDDNKNKIFTFWFRGELTKKIYFDSLRKIQKIELYKPTLLLSNKYDRTSQDFKIVINYNKSLPRLADTLTQYYEVRSGKILYRTKLNIYVSSEKSIKLESTKQGKFSRDIILSGAGSFYNHNKAVEEGLKKGFLKEVYNITD